jgi:hypothetical protein
MTKLSDLGPAIPGKQHGGDPVDERDNFMTCPICGQRLDMRDFRQVAWHDQRGHRPLESRSFMSRAGMDSDCGRGR